MNKLSAYFLTGVFIWLSFDCFSRNKNIFTDKQPEVSEVKHVTSADQRVITKFGKRCVVDMRCANILGIDCGSAADGPYYYVRENDLEIISYCGGYCMASCDNCPPAGLKNCAYLKN